MARKRTKAGPRPIEPPTHHAHIDRDAKGRLCHLGINADGSTRVGSGLTHVRSSTLDGLSTSTSRAMGMRSRGW